MGYGDAISLKHLTSYPLADPGGWGQMTLPQRLKFAKIYTFPRTKRKLRNLHNEKFVLKCMASHKEAKFVEFFNSKKFFGEYFPAGSETVLQNPPVVLLAELNECNHDVLTSTLPPPPRSHLSSLLFITRDMSSSLTVVLCSCSAGARVPIDRDICLRLWHGANSLWACRRPAHPVRWVVSTDCLCVRRWNPPRCLSVYVIY